MRDANTTGGCIAGSETGYAGCEAKTQAVSREPNFREVLDLQIYELERRLQGLRTLRVALPVELPHRADQVLRELLSYV